MLDFTGKTVTFNGPKLVPSGDEWVLTEQYQVTVGMSHRFVCAEGMWTDGASIPRFFWRLIGHPMQLPYVKAAVIHDGGYQGRLLWYDRVADEWILRTGHTRKDVDDLFLALLASLGVSWWRRTAMYQAVRWFGGKHWTER